MTTQVKVKKENYTAIQVAAISKIGNPEVYKNFEQQKAACEELAQSFGDHTPRQVLSKLQHIAKTSKSPNLVYHKKVYLPKAAAGTSVIPKKDLLKHLAELIGVEEESLSSLEGATKSVLITVIAAFEKLKNAVGDDEEVVDFE